MKKLNVPLLGSVHAETPIREIAAVLDKLEKNAIQTRPWPAFAYRPDVSFAIAHCGDGILLKYFVSENAIRIRYQNPNEPVYKDSCVEFFISFNGEEAYYNFEFNCIGACLLGFGAEKEGRRLLSEELIHQIKHLSVIHSSNDGQTAIKWELTVMIPLKVFVYHPGLSLQGRHCKANFFKCGDGLPDPHYLAWNNIASVSPNFHLPEFFGSVYFDS